MIRWASVLFVGFVAITGCQRKTAEVTEAPTIAVPQGARVKFDAGVVQMEAGATQYDDAIASFRAAILVDPTLWEAWLDIGVIELRRARLGEAAKALQKSLDIYASPQALDALGAVYLRQGKAERAVALYERALAKEPGSVPMRNALAAALRAAGKLDAAEIECRAVLGENAFDPAAYATLAAIMIDRNQLDLAEVLLNKGLARHPEHPLLLTNLGLVALRRGDDQQAMAMFDKASTADPTFVVGKLNKAGLYLGVGDHAKAKTELEAVLAIEPGNLEALLGLGIALRISGDLEGARKKWEGVLAIDDEHAGAHFNLGVLDMDHAQRPPTAKKHLERYLQIAGDGAAYAPAAKERLAILAALDPGGAKK